MSDEITNLFNDTKALVGGIFGHIAIAETEIADAIERHPDAADKIDSAFPLLQPTSELLTTNEQTYRSHCAELLDRVAAGQDTRPATDAEIIVGCSEASLRFPLGDATQGLYERLFLRVFGERAPEGIRESSAHLEALHGDEITRLEHQARHDVNVPDRVLDGA